MKTDKEAAEEFAGENWKSKIEESVIDIMHDSFLSGCKHKEESRWIPVSEKTYVAMQDYWIYDKKAGVVRGHYNSLWLRWYDSDNHVLCHVEYYSEIIVPPPPQTNK